MTAASVNRALRGAAGCLAEGLLPDMRARHWGRIINISASLAPRSLNAASAATAASAAKGTPHLVAFLASPLARYITGAVIPVNGGMRLCVH